MTFESDGRQTPMLHRSLSLDKLNLKRRLSIGTSNSPVLSPMKENDALNADPNSWSEIMKDIETACWWIK